MRVVYSDMRVVYSDMRVVYSDMIVVYSDMTTVVYSAGADPGGGELGVVTPPPALDHQFFFFSKLFKYMWITSHGQCPRRGGGVLVNVQEWVYFSIFWRADDVMRTMSKGGGCL